MIPEIRKEIGEDAEGMYFWKFEKFPTKIFLFDARHCTVEISPAVEVHEIDFPKERFG